MDAPFSASGEPTKMEWSLGRASRAVPIRNGLYALLFLCALPFVATVVLANDTLGLLFGLIMSLTLALAAAFLAVPAWHSYKSALVAPQMIGISHDAVAFRFDDREDVIAFSDVRALKTNTGRLDWVEVELGSGQKRTYPGIGYTARAIVAAWEVWKQDVALAGAPKEGVRIAALAGRSPDDESTAGFALMADGRLVPDLVWHGVGDGAPRPDAPGRWVSIPAGQLRLEAVIFSGLWAAGAMIAVMFGAIGTRTMATLPLEIFLGAPAATFLVGLIVWRERLLGGAARAELSTEPVLSKDEGLSVLDAACQAAGCKVQRTRWVPLGFSLILEGPLRLGFWRGGQPKLASILKAEATRPGHARELARLKGAVLEAIAMRGIDQLEEE